MSISPEERRFVRSWEEQRKGGKVSFVAIYTFGYFIIIFMSGVALGLFSGLRFVNTTLLISLASISLVAGVVFAFWQWARSQKKFSRIIEREIATSQQA